VNSSGEVQHRPLKRGNSTTGESVETGFDGKFLFEGLDATERLLVNVHKEGFAHNQTPIDVLPGVENTLLVTVTELDLIETFDAADGLSIDLGHRDTKVDLPADNFVDADGNAYTGEVTVEVVWYELDQLEGEGNELQATPGDFTAITMGGENVDLESFGMLQVNLLGADGGELQLAGQPAPMRLPIHDLGDGDAPVAGESVPAWSYDESNGKWIEEGEGTVVAGEDGALYWEFAAPHFSTWNVDRPLPSHGCVSGRLLDPWGTPREGVVVRLIGQSYIATTTARTSEDGTFCAEGKNGSTVFLEFQYTINNQIAVQRTDPITIPAGQGSCLGDWWDCVMLGDIPMEFNTCVSGVVVNGDNQAVQGAQVVSPQGAQAISDDNGAFCLTVPVLQQTEVYVVQDGQATTIFKPVSVFAKPGMPACQSGCDNFVVLRPYESTSCAEGTVSTNNNGQAMPVTAFDINFPNQPVSTAIANGDGSFCIEVPMTAEVRVEVGGGNMMCGSTFLQPTWGGITCDWAGMGECAQLGAFTCGD